MLSVICCIQQLPVEAAVCIVGERAFEIAVSNCEGFRYTHLCERLQAEM